jgi:glycosyltransferase involved in cell wall biosynthesis
MKILVANHSLVRAGGSETFTYTLVSELVKRGHEVELFCFEQGEYSERIINNFGVKFYSNKKRYDLILANHNTTVDKLYNRGLTIQTCHGIFPPLEQPSKKANGYVAISHEVQNHLFKLGFPSRIIYNGIDCDRYKPTKPLRTENPKVLSLCHSNEAHDLVLKACQLAKMEFGVLDKYEHGKWEVEEIINNYDIVIGLGRSAYEALACGRPVIIFDKRNYFPSFADGYFLDTITESLKNNCSGRALQKKINQFDLAEELKKYKPAHGDIARKYATLSFNISKTVTDYFSFAEVLNEIKESRKLKSKAEKFVHQLITNAKSFIPTSVKNTMKKHLRNKNLESNN